MFAWPNLVVLAGYLILALLCDVKFVYYYEHPDDPKYLQGLVAKLTTLAGLQLIWLVLALPVLDAFDARHDGAFDMQLCWTFVSLMTIVFILLPLPLAMAYYEADSDERVVKVPPWLQALIKASIIFVVAAILLAILYFVLRNLSECLSTQPKCNQKIPFQYFPLVIFTVLGWFPLVVSLSVGLAALPLHMIFGFIRRVKPVTQEEYSAKKKEMLQEIVRIKDIAEKLAEKDTKITANKNRVSHWKQRRQYDIEFNKFKQSVHLLIDEFNALNVAHKLHGENPFFSYCKLSAGILCSLMSLLWITQLLLNVIIPQVLRSNKMPFSLLDDLMLALTKADAFILDFLAYLFFVGYLLICVTFGCYRISMRLPILQINPFTAGGTHYNSFLFNILVILITILPVVQLFSMSFYNYTAGTELAVIFDDYLARMKVFGLLFKHRIFVWLVVLITIMAFAFLVTRSKEKKAIRKTSNNSKRSFWGYFGKSKSRKDADEGENKTSVGETVDQELQSITQDIYRVTNIATKLGVV